MAERQRTEAWKASRVGKITASKMKCVMALSKKDRQPLQARLDYLAELVVERLTGQSIGIPMTVAMQYGVDVEPHARAAYEAATGALVAETGFLVHPTHPFIGCSPDGLLGAEGGLELKCPYNSIVHMNTWIGGIPDEHIAQVQGSLWVTGRKWWDFVSFDPRMPEPLRLYRQRVERDEKYIAVLENECLKLNIDVNTMMQALLDRANALEAA